MKDYADIHGKITISDVRFHSLTNRGFLSANWNKIKGIIYAYFKTIN